MMQFVAMFGQRGRNDMHLSSQDRIERLEIIATVCMRDIVYG